jgi:O-succinylbenzoate synthase
MAVADTHLRARKQSLAGLLGVEGRQVEVGAVVGQADTTAALLEAVGALVDRGYRRVKLKIGPQWDVEPVAAVRAAFPDLLLQVDANGAYDSPGADGASGLDGADDDLWIDGHAGLAGGSRLSTRSDLLQLDPFGLLCIEQPFDRSDLAAHAQLARRMATPICLDESLDSPQSVNVALAMGACSVVCVKPSRLGGLGAALQVIDRCTSDGVPLWMGGMFESGYARGVITVVGALDGMAWPGDLSPARSYLEDDLVPDPSDPSDPAERGSGARLVALPAGPGMGPPPDPDALARLGARHQVISGPGG